MQLIEKRSIGTSIVLTFLTCGIYSWIWDYKVWSSLYKANGMENRAGTDLVLSLVTCGIYYIYMFYKAGKLESSAYAKHGLARKDDSTIYLLLTIFALWIIPLAMMQSNINNELADAVNGSAGGNNNGVQF